MALQNTLNNQGHWIRYGKVASWPLAASQTIKKGDFLKVSGTQCAQAITAPSATATLSTDGGSVAILGVALADVTTGATVTDADRMQVAIADDDLLVALRLYHATASSSEVQDATIGGATVYELERYAPAVSTAVPFYVVDIASGTTTQTAAQLIYAARCAESDVADDFGLVWVKVSYLKRAMP